MSNALTTRQVNGLLTTKVLSISQLYDLRTSELDFYRRTSNFDNYLNSEYVNIFILAHDPKLQSHKLKAIINLRNISRGKNVYMYCLASYLLSINVSSSSQEESRKIILSYLNFAHKNKIHDFDYVAYKNLGTIAYQNKKQKKARFYWGKCSEICKTQKNYLFYSSANNDIALSYLAEGNIYKGLFYTLKAVNIIKQHLTIIQNIDFYQNLKCNLAEIYIKLGEIKKAEKLLLSAYTYYKNAKNVNLHIPASILLDLSEKKPLAITDATILKDLKNKMKDPMELSDKIFYIRVIYKLLKKTNNLKEINEHLILALNSEHELNSINNLNQQETYLALTKDIYNTLNTNFSKQLKIQEQKNTIAYLIVFTVLAIGFSSFFYYKKASKYTKTIHRQSQILEESQKIIYLNKIQQKEEQIEKLQLNLELKKATEKTFLEKIKEVKKSKNVDIDLILKDLQIQVTNLLQIDNRHSENKKNDFDGKNDFIEKLISKHPDLSKGEKQLCMHLKLNLNSKEIAMIEGVGPASVRVYKTNLKKKLKLTQADNIYEYIQSL